MLDNYSLIHQNS